MNIDDFAGYSSALDALSSVAKDSIVELIWSIRGRGKPEPKGKPGPKGKPEPKGNSLTTTVCVVVLSLEDLERICGTVPSEVSEGFGRRYFVDLESMGTNYARFYVDRKDKYIIWGYVYDNGTLIETKKYKRNGNGILNLDRYDAFGILKSGNEVEKEVPIKAWRGDKELLRAAEKYDVICLLKPLSKHNYLRVTDHDSYIKNSKRILGAT